MLIPVDSGMGRISGASSNNDFMDIQKFSP
jgi:hypothetical protein